MIEKPIVFFDGICGLCNKAVDWFISRDADAKLRFAPLQGETAIRLVSPADRNRLDSIVLIKNQSVFRKSRAVAQALLELDGLAKLLGYLLLATPRPLADWAYGLVASSRYKIWGRHDTCRIPTQAERARFLP